MNVAINLISASINGDRKIWLWVEISNSFNNIAVSFS